MFLVFERIPVSVHSEGQIDAAPAHFKFRFGEGKDRFHCRPRFISKPIPKRVCFVPSTTNPHER